MKRIRLQTWSGQLLAARSGGESSASLAVTSRTIRPERLQASARYQSTTLASDIIFEDGTDFDTSTSREIRPTDTLTKYPSPLPEKALSSAKLAALHARLSLSQKIPLQTLARTLVDSTADANPNFNNTNLSFLGYTIINYHICEWLICRYPRLPMMIVYGAMKAYGGASSLHQVARQWGVESAAMPGDEVDPGLLQFRYTKDRLQLKKWGHVRPETQLKTKWRHGISSRVVMDDDFGDLVQDEPFDGEPQEDDPTNSSHLTTFDHVNKRVFADNVHADLVRAVVGSIYTHCGREAVKSFVKSHVLSRKLDFSSLFKFKMPTRDLAWLCARENFDAPVARLLSETGRLSRTPVFVVGIYSGKDKLGEGAAASLDAARTKAAINALKAWYLYSPGENIRVPSDMLSEGAKPWQPVYIDIGEIC